MIQIIGLICTMVGDVPTCDYYTPDRKFETMEECKVFGQGALGQMTVYGTIEAYHCEAVGEDA